MLIGEIVKRTGVTKETIRHWEDIGLIKGIKSRPNGYKIYPENLLEDVELIKLAKDLGFTLKEIKGMVMLIQKGQFARTNINEMLSLKIEEIDQKILDLKKLKKRLSDELIKTCTPQAKRK